MNSRLRWFAGLLPALVAVAAAAPLIACWEGEYRSVHFNSARPDFFRLPSQWRVRSAPPRALPPGERNNYDVYERDEERTLALTGLIRRARGLESAGQYRQAAALWGIVQQRVNRGPGGSRPEDQTNAPKGGEETWELPSLTGLPERIEALRTGAGPELKRYLRLRDQVSAGGAGALAALKALQVRSWPEPLERNRLYLIAAVHFQRRPNPEEFDAILRRYPSFGPAAYMAARARYRIATSRKPAAPADMEAAAEAYRAVAREVGGSLRTEAIRMLGGCRYRLKRYPEALEAYAECLAEVPAGERDIPSWLSARWTLREMTLSDHRVFRTRTEDRPEVARAYLDLLLDYGLQARATLVELGGYAVTVLARQAPGKRDLGVYVRLGALLERVGEPERAIQVLDRVLPAMRSNAARDRGQWARAKALQRLGRTREALSGFEQLAVQGLAPVNRRGAREAAAILRERAGDYADALNHYFALDYTLDAAYLLDCLASPDELRDFVRRYPGHPKVKLVRYSIGIRLLRSGDYSGAIRELEPLGNWLDVAEGAHPSMRSRGGKRMPPLELARKLLDCDRREKAAATRDEKANWAYEAARTVFHQRHLAFYNPVAWKGWRTFVFDRLEPDRTFRESPTYEESEAAKRDRYQREHAALHQALTRFDQIAARYAGTKQAPRALYSAALCCTLLQSLEVYWSDRERELYPRAISYYRRLVREYPADPLVQAARQYGGPTE